MTENSVVNSVVFSRNQPLSWQRQNRQEHRKWRVNNFLKVTIIIIISVVGVQHAVLIKQFLIYYFLIDTPWLCFTNLWIPRPHYENH